MFLPIGAISFMRVAAVSMFLAKVRGIAGLLHRVLGKV
jgi:hypothetical protein